MASREGNYVAEKQLWDGNFPFAKDSFFMPPQL